MRRVLVTVIALVIVSPVVLYFIPQSFDMERFQASLKAAGFVVEDFRKSDTTAVPGAVESYSMTVNGAQVDIYRFDNEGKIATQYEYNKPDKGMAIAQSTGLLNAMGLAAPKTRPILALRNGMYLALISHEDKTLNQRIGRIFSAQ